MKELTRAFVAGIAGAGLATAVLVGQPALADQVAKVAAKNSVTSKSIKNGTIQTKDLDAGVNGSLAKADSALQGIADNSINSAKVANRSLSGLDLVDSAISAPELDNDSVQGPEVDNHSLDAADVTAQSGVATLDFPSIGAGACETLTIATGSAALDQDTLVVSPSNTWPDGVVITATSTNGLGGSMDVVACNITAGALNPVNDSFGWAVLDN